MSTTACNLYVEQVAAGFPSPARDYLEEKLDLNEHLVPHPVATFFVKVSGNSMTGAGIFPGDLLIVDRSLEAHHGSIIVAVVDGEFTVKRLQCVANQVLLKPENPSHRPIRITDQTEFTVWGVVTYAIHAVRDQRNLNRFSGEWK